MKHIFIVNSIFSSDKDVAAFCERVRETCERRNIAYEIHKTAFSGDARGIAREKAETGEKLRIYACGGDGTVNEVVGGICGFDNAELAIIPLGTGNDFIRSYGDKSAFLDLDRMIDGDTVRADLIKWNDNYCMNIMNVGFDRAVVATVEKLRKNPLIAKSVAYTVGVIVQFIKLPMERLKITFDDGQVYDDKFLIALFANGKYYGGGFKAASKADTGDGLIDVMIIRPVGRFKFLSFVGKYKNGTALDTEFGKRIIVHKRVKKVIVEKETPFDMCFDGEIKSVCRAEIEILPMAVKLVAPAGLGAGKSIRKSGQPALIGGR